MATKEVLIIDSGGRGSELARICNDHDDVSAIYCLDGNAGTDGLEKVSNVPIKPTDIDKIVQFASEKKPGLTIISQEAPLVAGLTDPIEGQGLPVFGPTKKAAEIEGSKIFSQQLMQDLGIPHPESIVARSLEDALRLNSYFGDPYSYVIKLDGLARGQGVVLPNDTDEAQRHLKNMFNDPKHQEASKNGVLFQRKLEGQEISAFAVSDGQDFVMLPFSRDYKRLKDNDEGPNTGGMGAYAPVEYDEIITEKIKDIAATTIEGMEHRGTPFKGLLYMGLILEKDTNNLYVFEYNARLGDPETQVVLPLLQMAGVDVVDMLFSAAEGKLRDPNIPSQLGKVALTTAIAAAGYPREPQIGQVIHGLDQSYDNLIIQHGNTKRVGDEVLTNGGRALYLTGIGDNKAEAHAASIDPINQGLGFDGMQYRTDIGK